MPDDCIFCSIVAGKIPAKKVLEDERVLAFLDINPRNPGHTLVVPKKHIETILETSDSEAAHLIQVVKKTAAAVKAGTNADGISIAQSNGKAAGQLVPHMHFHVIPRFETEGPVGLEGFLPVKKMDEDSLDKIAGNIKDNMGGEAPAPETEEPETERPEETAEGTSEEKPAEKPEKKKKKPDFDDEFEDIDFDL